ncbi:MAG: TatD family hydrolase [Flavobacteriaceae bacterium]|nr:TatD family hydrolase [Flavobacteriaceae bacterium]
MILTDTHAHLYAEDFNADRELVLKRAIDAGVQRFFIPAIDSNFYPAMHALKLMFPDNIFLMAGLHPTHVKAYFEEELRVVQEQLQLHSYCAIGEIGLDLYWDKSHFDEQRSAFNTTYLGQRKKTPVVIHCRDAFDEIFEVLEGEADENLWGIFHCFTGTYEQAQRAIGFNMKLGIGGAVTFKNGKIDQFLDRIALEHIVLETDAPYMAPVPYRGKRNESLYILQILNKLSEIYKCPKEEIARITTENSKAVFGI